MTKVEVMARLKVFLSANSGHTHGGCNVKDDSCVSVIYSGGDDGEGESVDLNVAGGGTQ